MSKNRLTQALRYTGITLLATLIMACSNTASNLRIEQSSSVLTGGKNFVMVGVRSTVLAAIRQPITTTRSGLAVLWNRPREIIRGNSPAPLTETSLISEAPGTAAFETMLDHKKFPRTEFGQLAYFVDGPEFFPELDRQIAAARQFINIQVYIFDNDDIAVRYADALKNRSTEIPVRIIFDDLGSTLAQHSAPKTLGPRGFLPPSDMSSYLRQNSKTRARRTLNPWLVCDHSKLMVFDNKTALLGGMNIGREYYSEWHDLMIRVQGPIVQSLTGDFKQSWRKAGPWGDLALLRKPTTSSDRTPTLGEIPMRILRTDPAVGRYEILDSTLLAIRGARKRIWIQNPYFASDEIALAVEAAARRGVDVRIIIPHTETPNLMDAGNLATANGLIHAGAKVYVYNKMTHLKAILCDNWASIGSANFDTLSMRINRELNLVFSEPTAIRKLESTVFLPDFQKSRRLRLKETNNLTSSLAETLADQL